MVAMEIKRNNLINGGKKKNWIKCHCSQVIGASIVMLLAISLTPWLHSQDSGKDTGGVDDCCCDYETVDRVNRAFLHPLLQELVMTHFFRYFEVNLWRDCPFWPDDDKCPDRNCILCEWSESEPCMTQAVDTKDGLICQEAKPEAAVDRINDDEPDSGYIANVNLQLIPERYTGYTGKSARRIWDAVYSQICPKNSSEESCPEEKVLYRLMSGLHSSISVHIATGYLLDKKTTQWGANPQLMYDRVLNHPERVQRRRDKLLKAKRQTFF